MRPRPLPLVLCLLAAPLAAREPDYDVLNRIRQEGFHESQVMELARHLTDHIGPRLTGSPGLRQANEWTRQKFAEWGLAEARLEPFEFGEGWSFSKASVRLVEPGTAVLRAQPKAWTPGTDGAVRGEVMRAKIEEEKDLEALNGKVAGKILLLDEPPEPKSPDEPVFDRHDEDDLAELAKYEIPDDEDDREVWLERRRERIALGRKRNAFLAEEGALATIEVSSFEHGVVRVTGGGNLGIPGEPVGVPALVMAVEPYSRLLRLLDDEVTPVLEIEVEAERHDETTQAFNTLAEIAGEGRKPEIVMAGAHLDSWHGGTGATDDGAGVVVVMEAARILSSLGLEPRRSIRFALWGGEEQGLLGSEAHVEEHFAHRPPSDEPEERELPERYRRPGWPIEPKPDFARFSVYLNIDNGGGAVRGIWAQENLGAMKRFERWIEPLSDLGVTTVTMRETGSTDHVPFDRVGLPGFQFIQDRRDYSTRTHHSDIDTYEHLSPEDLKQASVVLASLLWQAANDPQPFPRKPMPEEPEEEEERKKDQNEETPATQ
ncbi:MAG: M20/M25/M40 family metallo-hydrolase [Thermoanaerobaculia bacterium]